MIATDYPTSAPPTRADPLPLILSRILHPAGADHLKPALLALVERERAAAVWASGAARAQAVESQRLRLNLSTRAMQVLGGVAEGMSNAEIGRWLHITEDTVKTHLRRLFRSLGAHDRAHAVAIGYQSGLLGGPS